MFRSASLFIGTSFTVAVFTLFATSNVDSIVGIPHKIYSMQRILILIILLILIITLGGYIHYGTPQIWLNSGCAAISFCFVLASDWWSSFHTFANKMLIRFGSCCMSQFIMSLCCNHSVLVVIFWKYFSLLCIMFSPLRPLSCWLQIYSLDHQSKVFNLKFTQTKTSNETCTQKYHLWQWKKCFTD